MTLGTVLFSEGLMAAITDVRLAASTFIVTATVHGPMAAAEGRGYAICAPDGTMVWRNPHLHWSFPALNKHQATDWVLDLSLHPNDVVTVERCPKCGFVRP